MGLRPIHRIHHQERRIPLDIWRDCQQYLVARWSAREQRQVQQPTPFISYHLGDGWAIGSSPKVTANWLSKAGQVWTLPVGGGISKTFRLGDRPTKLSVDSYYNAIRPQAGSETWLLQIKLTFLFPT
jgi:hypothetical protein